MIAIPRTVPTYVKSVRQRGTTLQLVLAHRLFCVFPNCYFVVNVPSRPATAHTVVARTLLERGWFGYLSPKVFLLTHKGDWPLFEEPIAFIAID